jgi:hypothetical protein
MILEIEYINGWITSCGPTEEELNSLNFNHLLTTDIHICYINPTHINRGHKQNDPYWLHRTCMEPNITQIPGFSTSWWDLFRLIFNQIWSITGSYNSWILHCKVSWWYCLAVGCKVLVGS